VKRKRSSFFGSLVIISIFLFSPSYIAYEELIEADFLSSGKKYEDRDAENFSLDKQPNLTIDSSPSSISSLRGNNLLDLLTGLSLQIPLSDQKPVTLRC
jgi:hypothetical protein